MFSGILMNHPDREKIEKFLDTNNIKLEFLSNQEILDIGTIITLNC